MFNLSEYRKSETSLLDYLVWAALIDDGVVLNKTGSFQKTYLLMGQDLDVAEEYDINLLCQRLNNCLKRIGDGWAIFYDVDRSKSISYPLSQFPDKVSLLIDEERRYQFEEYGNFFETNVYLTLVWLPPSISAKKTEGWFINQSRGNDYGAQALEQFKKESSKIAEMLKNIFIQVKALNGEETLSYLHQTVSTKKHPVNVPDNPMYLDYLLADQPVTGGFNPKVGDHHLKILTIRYFPGESMSELLGDLSSLDMSFRWTTRWIALGKEEGKKEIKKHRGRLFSKRLDLWNMIGGAFGVQLKEKSQISSDADDKAMEMSLAEKWLEGDLLSYGYYTTTIQVVDTDPVQAHENITKIETFINNKGFTCVVETKNAIEAWLGSLPGNTYANVRRPMLNSANLSHLLSLSNPWVGQCENKHLKKTSGEGAPLMLTQTIGNTPWRAVFHCHDVGHTMIVGPTGRGKSTFLMMSAFQFLRYPNSRVIIFDKGYSALVSTYSVKGGMHYDLGGELSGNSFALQPLSQLETEEDIRWAQEWVESLLENFGCHLTPKKSNAIANALRFLSKSSSGKRTMTSLRAYLMDSELQEVMLPFVGNGPYANLLDGDKDIDIESNWICFEMSSLMANSRKVLVPVLSALFRKLKKQFVGNPTKVILDEFWEYIDDPYFVKMARSWLKTERKNNVSIWMATQTLSDAINAENKQILSSLLEDVPNRVFLPNSAIKTPKVKELYESFGLNESKIDIIEKAIEKRHYFYDSVEGTRLFDLAIGPVGLAFSASSGVESARNAHEIYLNYGNDGFASQWLSQKGLSWAATCLEGFSFKDNMPLEQEIIAESI